MADPTWNLDTTHSPRGFPERHLRNLALEAGGLRVDLSADVREAA